MHDIPDLGELDGGDGWVQQRPWCIQTIGTYVMRVIDHPEADKALVIGLPTGVHLHLPMRPEMVENLLEELTK